MDPKIEILIICDTFSAKKIKILPDSLRHIRLILSIFNEEIIPEDEFGQLIEDLTEEGFLSKLKDQELDITPIGSALIKSIGRKKIGDTNYERLSRIAFDYALSKGGPEFIKKIGERLRSLHYEKENKIKTVDKTNIRALGVRINVEHVNDDLHVSEFQFARNHLKDALILNREINKLKNNLFKRYGIPFSIENYENLLTISGLTPISSIIFFNESLDCSNKSTINRNKIFNWNILIVNAFLEKYLKKLGFISYKGSKKFINFKKEYVPPGSCGLREYDSLKLEFIQLNEDNIFVFIESYKSSIYSLLDFINICLKKGNSIAEIDKKILKLKLKANPYGTRVDIKELFFDKNLKKEKIPNINCSIFDYWEKVYGITLSSEIQPMIVTQNGLFYPSEMIKIDYNSLTLAYGMHPKRRPRYENIEERYQKIEKLLTNFEILHDEILEEFFTLNFIENSSNLKTLIDLKGFNDLVKISPPILEFFRGNLSIDPIEVFNPEFGAYCGKKNLTITHLMVPEKMNESEIAIFLDSIQRIFKNSNFGILKKAHDIKIKKFSLDSNASSLQDEIRKFEKISNHDAIGFVVIPDYENQYYFNAKKLFPVRTAIPMQIITESTFADIIMSKFGGSKFLSLQILIKTLKHGEAIWILASTAGLLKENTLYVGLGFSQQPQERKISKCATVMHDAHGAKITWKVFATPHQNRTLDAFWFENLLNRTYDIVEKEKPTRIVFYRTGTLFPIERNAVETALLKCPWLNSIKLSFVSILDSSGFRFFKENCKRKNLPAGYGIIINEKEALISTSNYDNRELKQGTVIPIKVKIEFGKDKIIDILQEYHDLTYLNWQAPMTTAKHPLVVTIADRFAELTREGVPTENTFYLDL